jgi:hypothetical protein
MYDTRKHVILPFEKKMSGLADTVFLEDASRGPSCLRPANPSFDVAMRIL